MTRLRNKAMRLSPEVRMDQILAAATEEFRLASFEKASMSAIAARAGVVEGSIYRFFDNKAALLTRAIETWYEQMLESYARELSDISGTRARLRFMIWRHVQTVYEDPELCRLMFDNVRSSPDYRSTEVYRLNRLYTMRTLDIVQEGIDGGELRAGLDMRLVRDLIYGGVEHHTWAYLWSGGTLDPDGLADSIVDLVLAGVGAPDPTAERLAALTAKLNKTAI